MIDLYSLRPDLVRNLFLLDSSIDRKKINDSLIKFYWGVYGANHYGYESITFNEQEKLELVMVENYEGYPLPKFISSISKIFGKHYLESAYKNSKFNNKGFDLFLCSYSLYVAISLIKIKSFPQDFLDWILETRKIQSNDAFEIPRIFYAKYLEDENIKSKFDLNSVEGLLGLLGYGIRWLLPNLNINQLPVRLENMWSHPAKTIENSKFTGMTIFHEAIYCEMDLIDRWLDINIINEALAFNAWMLANLPAFSGFRIPLWSAEELNKEFVIINNLRINRLVAGIIFNKFGSGIDLEDTSPSNLYMYLSYVNEVIPIINSKNPQFMDCIDIPNTFGVNLVGWPRTEIGIGEDVRVASLVFAAAGIPFAIIDAAKKIRPNPRQIDGVGSEFIFDQHLFNTDIVYLDAATSYRYYLDNLINTINPRRKIIGVFPWELPNWPTELKFALDGVSQFWAATNYIKNAFDKFFDGRIFLAPPAVVIPDEFYRPLSPTRAETFKFLTIFDGLSSIYRKNPFAVVRAFKKAFKHEKRVHLIIKMMNLPTNSSEASELFSLVANDERIQFISDTLPQKQLWSLIGSCDSFISLHRSEGFGRNIAESMLLGRPVICSAFGGNLDFCFDENSYLVQGEIIPVGLNQYSNASGQVWFDPSIEEAVLKMRDIFDDYQLAKKKALLARAYIKKYHSINSVKINYRNLLGL